MKDFFLRLNSYVFPSRKHNMKYNNFEYDKHKIILNSMPQIYILGLSNICQLHCPLCITGLRKQDKTPQFMDWDLFVEVVEKIKDIAVQVQLYKWGESLLHPKIIDILEYCNRYDLNTEISSNLSLKDIDDKLEAMVKYRLKHLIVSFDGLTQDVYEKYRVGGDPELVKANIKKLHDLKLKYNSKYPKISLQFLRNKYTKEQISSLENSYKELGADEYYVCDMTTIFKDRSYASAIEWLEEEDINRRKYCDIDLSMQGSLCYFLYKVMIIEQDGSIPPCCFSTNKSDDYSKWDNSKSIKEMYNSEKFRISREMFKDLKLNKQSTCHNCTMMLTYNGSKE